MFSDVQAGLVDCDHVCKVFAPVPPATADRMDLARVAALRASS